MNAIHSFATATFIGVAAMTLVATSACSTKRSAHTNVVVPDAGAPECDALATRANLCGAPGVERALDVVRSMTLEEKVQQMSGPALNSTDLYDQEDNARLGVPGFRYLDGTRGARWYTSDHGTTVFPVAAARASSWDVELERRIGKAIASEMRLLGRHVLLAPMLNQVAHPRWGRAQESYGEDSFLIGEMGRAFITGVQHDPTAADANDPGRPPEDTYRVLATATHFAANNIENTRLKVNAVLDERTLREVYLPHFEKAVGADVSAFMASFNRVNGTYTGMNEPLLRRILKGDWRFAGFVVSDWFATGNTLLSPVAGLDVEMPFSSCIGICDFGPEFYYGSLLVNAAQGGQVDVGLIDEAALRIVYQKVRNGVLDHAPRWAPELTRSQAAQDLALRAARAGIVLLKNGPARALEDDVLPLARTAIRRIAVVGTYADRELTGDKASSSAQVLDPALVVTPFEGIRDALSGTGALVTALETVAADATAVGASDAVVIVTGYRPSDLAASPAGEEGEWRDRASLTLAQRDLDNIRDAVALKATCSGLRIIVVIKSGGAVEVKDWVDQVDAVLMAWYAGMKEGTAVAEILFGDVNPSGKLVQSFPRSESDLPAFDNANTGDVTYGYYHGYRWLERNQVAPQYAFGFGLSYSKFAYSNLQVATPSIADDGELAVTVDVKNTGSHSGSEVVQLYVGCDGTSVHDAWGRPRKELKAFARVADIAPGETRHVTLSVKARELGYWDVGAHAMRIEKTSYRFVVAPSSDESDPNTRLGSFTVQ